MGYSFSVLTLWPQPRFPKKRECRSMFTRQVRLGERDSAEGGFNWSSQHFEREELGWEHEHIDGLSVHSDHRCGRPADPRGCRVRISRGSGVALSGGA